MERERYDPYEIVITGRRERTEISRTTLRDREIKNIPGTFGDPFRVIHTLPGVSSIISLLPFPIVRGTAPGNTGFSLDRVGLPLLFHLNAGPAVIHPELIDEVHFYPGGFPVLYGGYTGGIVDGETRRARPDEKVADVDLNLLQTGIMVRHPVTEKLSFTAAGRIGYPGVIISLATDQLSMSYWDYQARVDGRTKYGGWTIFAFGANDEILVRDASGSAPEGSRGKLEPVLVLGFHRLDLRYQEARGRLRSRYQLVGGLDQSQLGPETQPLGTWNATPRTDWSYRLLDELDLGAGLGGQWRRAREISSDVEDEDDGFEELTKSFPKTVGTATGYVEAHWRPTPRVLIRPGLRSELYMDSTDRELAVDPRLSARYRVTDPPAKDGEPAAPSDAVWVKGGVGIYHQPPRFLIPLPGLDQLPIEFGLLRSLQGTAGTELPLGGGFSLDAQTYYSHMDPIVFDLQFNADPSDVAARRPEVAPGELPEAEEEEDLDDFIAPQRGRAYGLELLLRRRSKDGVYGWLSYTLSKSERRREGQWVPFDFDRTHVMSLVVGVPLPRNWELGARVQLQSGAPATTTKGYNAGRNDNAVRVDLRIDKRAVWRDWLLDFYIDIANATLSPEEVAPGETFRYVLPTVGFRGKL